MQGREKTAAGSSKGEGCIVILPTLVAKRPENKEANGYPYIWPPNNAAYVGPNIPAGSFGV